jgi:hypothetical protein
MSIVKHDPLLDLLYENKRMVMLPVIAEHGVQAVRCTLQCNWYFIVQVHQSHLDPKVHYCDQHNKFKHAHQEIFRALLFLTAVENLKIASKLLGQLHPMQ